MHDGVVLGGPVWLVAQVLILGTVGLSVFVLVDSITPRRRGKVKGELVEPLWVYSAAMALYIGLLISVQIIPGMQVASAVAAIATPFALAGGIGYLLRAVYPKHTPEGVPKRPGVEEDVAADPLSDR